MQLLAMLTMLVDHIGLVFFPEQEGWRIIGRIAFPLYVYALVQGYEKTSSRQRYLLRLGIIAAISQVPYELALNPGGLNVVVSLLAGAMVLKVLDFAAGGALLSLAVIAGAAVVMEMFPFDYGAYGLILILLFRYARAHELVLGHLLLNVLYLFLNHWIVQMWSLLPTLLLAYGGPIAEKLAQLRINRWVWRSFYPLHLAVIAILRLLLVR